MPSRPVSPDHGGAGGHHHPGSPSLAPWRLGTTIGLNLAISVVEIAGGLLSGSLSLLADALHNFSDGAAVVLTAIALRLGDSRHTTRHTFGLKRAELLVAVLNTSVLLAVMAFLFYGAVGRMVRPAPVSGAIMSGVAVVGLLGNAAGTWLLRPGAERSLGVRSAYLHLLGDAASSLAIVVGGLAIAWFRAFWIDPLVTIVVGAWILRESWHVLASALHLLMEGVPSHIELAEIQEAVESLPEVDNLHHVHVWAVGEDDVHLEAHVHTRDMLLSASREVGGRIETLLSHRFGIRHVTLQLECNGCDDVGLVKQPAMIGSGARGSGGPRADRSASDARSG